MTPPLSRRDFLKLATLTPLLGMDLPQISGAQQNLANKGTHPNIFILVFDALSAAHMSLFGYPRETTPNLDRFAERATVYHRHYAGGNFTSSGTASIFTGTYPWAHRALHLHGTVTEAYAKRNMFSLLPEDIHTFSYSHNLLVTSLLHQFQEDIDLFINTRELCLVDDEFSDLIFSKDYNTSFFSEWLMMRGGETNPGSLFLSLPHRMLRYMHKRGITQDYGKQFPRGVPNLHNLFFVLEDAIDWVMEQLTNAPNPFLGYVHLLPPHEPYTTRHDFMNIFEDGWAPPPKPGGAFPGEHSEEQLKKERREYDEYLAYADAEFGRLYDFMLERGVLDDTCFIFTSDHGELFERGIRGHVTPVLYEPVVRIPLLISKPEQREREDIHSLTSNVDILPTLLHLTGKEIPDWCEGEVLPGFDGGGMNEDRKVFAVEAKSNPKHAPLTKASITLINGKYKWTQYFGNGGQKPELFDLGEDPEEMENLYVSRSSLASELQAELEERLDRENQAFIS